MVLLKNGLKALLLSCCALSLILLTGPLPVWAHSFSVTTSFNGVGYGENQTSNHEDADPFKGWLNLTVTNTGTEAWGDFHFQLFQVTGPIDNVFFDVASPNEPVSSQSGLTWSVSSGGHVLDLYFYSDPVDPDETATFDVYTDNTTDEVSFFGTLYYPTPVPIPGACWLLGCAFIGLVGIVRKSNR